MKMMLLPEDMDDEQLARELDALIAAKQEGVDLPAYDESGELARGLVGVSAEIQPDLHFQRNLERDLLAAAQAQQTRRSRSWLWPLMAWWQAFTHYQPVPTLAGVGALVIGIILVLTLRPIANPPEATQIANATPSPQLTLPTQPPVTPLATATATIQVVIGQPASPTPRPTTGQPTATAFVTKPATIVVTAPLDPTNTIAPQLSPTATATQQPSPTPTAIAPSPTATANLPTATATIVPSIVPLPLTFTPTPLPTATMTPQTATPTITPTPTPYTDQSAAIAWYTGVPFTAGSRGLLGVDGNIVALNWQIVRDGAAVTIHASNTCGASCLVEYQIELLSNGAGALPMLVSIAKTRPDPATGEPTLLPVAGNVEIQSFDVGGAISGRFLVQGTALIFYDSADAVYTLDTYQMEVVNEAGDAPQAVQWLTLEAQSVRYWPCSSPSAWVVFDGQHFAVATTYAANTDQCAIGDRQPWQVSLPLGALPQDNYEMSLRDGGDLVIGSQLFMVDAGITPACQDTLVADFADAPVAYEEALAIAQRLTVETGTILVGVASTELSTGSAEAFTVLASDSAYALADAPEIDAVSLPVCFSP